MALSSTQVRLVEPSAYVDSITVRPSRCTCSTFTGTSPFEPGV
ncbi:hypothetical protein [Tsukamurella strandjordii]